MCSFRIFLLRMTCMSPDAVGQAFIKLKTFHHGRHGGHGKKLCIVNSAAGAVNKMKLCDLCGELLLSFVGWARFFAHVLAGRFAWAKKRAHPTKTIKRKTI